MRFLLNKNRKILRRGHCTVIDERVIGPYKPGHVVLLSVVPSRVAGLASETPWGILVWLLGLPFYWVLLTLPVTHTIISELSAPITRIRFSRQKSETVWGPMLLPECWLHDFVAAGWPVLDLNQLFRKELPYFRHVCSGFIIFNSLI